MPTLTTTLTTTLSTTIDLVQHDPIVGVCYVGSVLAVMASVILVVKTVRLRRSIRATLRERRAASSTPSVPR